MLDDAPINRNMIVHGAPGTGKSHYIEDLQRLYFDDDKVQRVTFYPNYLLCSSSSVVISLIAA